MNKLDDQVVVASQNDTTSSSISRLSHMFNPLSKSLYSIMNNLVSDNMIKIPHVKPNFPSTTLSRHFNTQAFCEFRRQSKHDTEAYYSLKHNIKDLLMLMLNLLREKIVGINLWHIIIKIFKFILILYLNMP